MSAPAEWTAAAEKELRGADPASLVVTTPEGIDVKPLYTEADLEGLDHLGSLPGSAPYVRGPRATMYTNRPWTCLLYTSPSPRDA